MAASHAYGGNTGSYAQTLLSRFNLPAARQGLGAPTAGAAADFYGLLGAALGHMGAGVGLSREAQVETISRSGALVPPELTSTAEKMTFLATQRERLKVLLTALDREASDLSHEEMMERDVEIRSKAAGTPAEPGDGLKKSKSEAEFEAIEREEWGSEKAVTERGGDSPPTAAAGGWIPWGIWGSSSSRTGKSTAVDQVWS